MIITRLLLLTSTTTGRLALVAGLLLSAPSEAGAAAWGSFDSSRIAYSTGSLMGPVHGDLRAIIEANGDTVEAPTDVLTPEYLADIDVFYTGMLSDGTGPSAGDLGTLSLDERAALQDWISDGGTLIITPDSNGFDGPWPMVYESWTADYGVTNYSFNFGPGTGSPIVEHPITTDVDNYSLDGTASFEFPGEGYLLGTALAPEDPLVVVFEPASGFLEGGRMLIVADHNALTNNFLALDDNTALAENIVGWASARCGNMMVEGDEECDDGNNEDGDGCSAACLEEEDSGSSSSSSGAGSGSSGSSGGQVDSSGGGGSADGEDSGCGCRSAGGSGALGWGVLLLALGAGRRRRG